jgi:phage tail-like protein
MAIEAGADAIGNHAWQVEVGGRTIAQFKEASGLGTEVSVIEQIENKPGGIPVTLKLPGIAKWSDITLKRGISDDPGWWKWIKEVQDGKIDGARAEASIVLYSYERGEKMRFNLIACWPSKVTLSALQAGGTEIAMEEVTLVHQGLEIA